MPRISFPALCKILTMMWFAASAKSAVEMDLSVSFDKSDSIFGFLAWDKASTRFVNGSFMSRCLRRKEWNWRRGA
jgi:hypothetical protein